MDNLYNYCDQPPHCFYIHFLVLLSALYLPLFAVDVGYNTGWGTEVCEFQGLAGIFRILLILINCCPIDACI